MSRRAAIYGRYSVEEVDGTDPEERRTLQLSVARDYCRRESIEVLAEYFDAGISGAAELRPGLDALRADAPALARAGVELLVVRDYSRLARDEALFGYLVHVLGRSGLEVVSATEQSDPTVRSLLALGAAMYRRNIQARVREWVARRRLDRRRYGSRHRAPGFRWVGDSLELVEEEVPTVRAAFDLVVSGVAIATVGRRIGWSRDRLLGVIRNPIYAGGYPLAPRRARARSGRGYRLRPPGEVPVDWSHHPGIVSRETWDAAQGVLAARARRHAVREPAPRCAVSGLLVCGVCGSRMKLAGWKERADGRRRYYYRCRPPGCGRVRTLGIVSPVAALLRRLLELFAEPQIADALAGALDAARAAGSAVELARADVARLSAEERNLVDAIAAAPLPALLERLRVTSAALSSARAAVAAAEVGSEGTSPDAVRTWLRELSAEISAAPDLEDISTAARPLLERCVSRIVVDPSGSFGRVELAILAKPRRVTGSCELANLALPCWHFKRAA